MIKGLLNHLRKMHIIFSLLFVIPSTMAISIMDQDVNEVRSFNDINLNLCTKKSTIIWCVTIVRTFGGLMIIDTQMNLCSWSKYFTTWMMCNYFGIRRFANRKLIYKEPIILGKDDSQNLIHNSIFWLLCINDTIMIIFSTWEWFLNGSWLWYSFTRPFFWQILGPMSNQTRQRFDMIKTYLKTGQWPDQHPPDANKEVLISLLSSLRYLLSSHSNRPYFFCVRSGKRTTWGVRPLTLLLAALRTYFLFA